MRITQNQKQFQLEVVGYQYPYAEGKYDRNWLLVKVHVVEGEKKYETVDPFLLAEDISHIIEWFQALPNPTYTELDFIEPNLCFAYVGEKDGLFEIDIQLTLEITPPWATNDTHVMKFFITEIEREEIVRSLHRQGEKFPERTE